LAFGKIYGVDFSGAKLASKNTWVAWLEPLAREEGPPTGSPLSHHSNASAAPQSVT